MLNQNVYDLFKDKSRCSKYVLIALIFLFITSFTVINKQHDESTDTHKVIASNNEISELRRPELSFTKNLLCTSIKDLFSYESGAVGNLQLYHIILSILLAIVTYYLHRFVKNIIHRQILAKVNIDEHKEVLRKISLTTSDFDLQTKLIISNEYETSLNKVISQIRFCTFISCSSFGLLVSVLLFGSLASALDIVAFFVLVTFILLSTLMTHNVFISSFMPLYVQINVLKGRNIDTLFETLDE